MNKQHNDNFLTFGNINLGYASIIEFWIPSGSVTAILRFKKKCLMNTYYI